MWTVYGWWLPNDPRGSTSKVVRSDFLNELGELHFGRKTLQPASRDIRAFYEQAKSLLKYPLLDFNSSAIKSVGTGFDEALQRFRYTCYACAILPDHVHLLIRKHKHTAEEMIANLQHFSRLRLSADGSRSADHPTWTRGGWKVFLDHPDEVIRTINYIDRNPIPYLMKKQKWPFVTLYDNWPLHRGHSLNSPYVKALRADGRDPIENR